MDRELLKSHHITHVVQVIDAPWAQISEADGFRCLRIDIHDKPTADLKPHLEGACQYIANALASGGNVLVHCQQVRSKDPDNTGTLLRPVGTRIGYLPITCHRHRLPHP